jgi:hypothetical protein
MMMEYSSLEGSSRLVCLRLIRRRKNTKIFVAMVEK